MKKVFPSIVILCALLAACNNNSGNSTTTTQTQTDSMATMLPATLDSMCYVLTDGKNNKDTMAIKLITEGNEVSGRMMYLYYEKDWRFGKLSGKRNGDMITARWVFMQEGMVDSSDVVLKLQGNTLQQKVPSYDASTGREVLTDTATFRRTYQKIDCATFPKYDFDFGL